MDGTLKLGSSALLQKTLGSYISPGSLTMSMSFRPAHTNSWATTCSHLSYVFKSKWTKLLLAVWEALPSFLVYIKPLVNVELGLDWPEISHLFMQQKKNRQHRGSMPPSLKSNITTLQGNHLTFCPPGLVPHTTKNAARSWGHPTKSSLVSREKFPYPTI